jgi:hypothetical protein
MLTKWDLQREVGSLEMLISALSNDLVREKSGSAQGTAETTLLKEMEEALCELRQARGLTKVLLVAITEAAGEAKKAISADAVRPAPGRKMRRILCH